MKNEKYQDEMLLVQALIRNNQTEWTAETQNLILKYLSSFIDEGIDTITDDGYLLYLEDVEREITDYMMSQITADDFLKLAIASFFENDEAKKETMQKLKDNLISQYQGIAPVPKRTLEEYIQYADSQETRDNFQKCYLDYVKAIDEIKEYCSEVLDRLSTSLQTERTQQTTQVLLAFMNGLDTMQSEDYYRTLAYQASIPTEKLFYQKLYLSEDADKTIQNVLNKPIDFASIAPNLSLNYSLEELYQAIPKDIVSAELLESEELDPNSLNHDIAFVQTFYNLALLLCSRESDDENFERKINEFLIQKVISFQEEFSQFSLSDRYDYDIGYAYTKRNQ